jgi:phosphomevalonate kinase
MTDASAPGKLILVGEYAVLEGAPAIVAAINVRAQAQVVAIPGPESVFFDALSSRAYYFVIDSSVGLRWVGECPEANGTILEAVIASCSEHSALFVDGPSFRISMNTDDFFTNGGGHWTKLGVGSSAAVLVAFVGALMAELNLAPTPEELLTVCHAAHRRFQGGSGSGADIATALYGGVVVVRSEAAPENISATACNWPSNLVAMPIWSGVSASTPELLARFDKFKGASPDQHRHHLRRLKTLSEQACVAWSKESIIDILDTLASYDEALCSFDAEAEIGICTEPHARIRQLVEQQGAVYKTSGAGGGDFGLALSDSTEVIDAVRADCLESGFKVLDKIFAVEGLKVS